VITDSGLARPFTLRGSSAFAERLALMNGSAVTSAGSTTWMNRLRIATRDMAFSSGFGARYLARISDVPTPSQLGKRKREWKFA
jgi:hypothetical protein